MQLKPKLVLLGLLPMLASCGTDGGQSIQSTPVPLTPSTKTGQISVIDPLCSQLRIVLLSKLDTDGTKGQVEANNAVWRAVCPTGDVK